MSAFEKHLTSEVIDLVFNAHAWLHVQDPISTKYILTGIIQRFRNPQAFTVQDIPFVERDIAYTFCLKTLKNKEFYLTQIAHLNSENLTTLRSLAPFVTKDPDHFKSEIIKRMAIDQHDVIACYEYGAKLMNQGLTHEGLSFLEISAKQKFWRAQLEIGQYYATKTPRTSTDLEKAIFMLNLAHNNPNKQVRTIGLLDLGIIYYESAELEGIEEDFKKAFDLFTEIDEEGGFKEAKLFLSICYFFGQGTQKNPIKAMTLLNDWLKEVKQEDLVQDNPFKTPIGFVMSAYAQLAAYLAQPGMSYSNLPKALEYAQYLNQPIRRRQLPIKLLTIEIIYEKLITPYLDTPVDIGKPDSVDRFKFALQMLRPILETQAVIYLSDKKAIEALNILDLVFAISENEIIYYFPKYITMLHNLMKKVSKSLVEISRKYKMKQPTAEEISDSYQLPQPTKPKKKDIKVEKQPIPPQELKTKVASVALETPELPEQKPAPEPVVQKVKKAPAVKLKTREQDTQRAIQDLTRQLKEEEAKIDKFYLEKASSPVKKIYHEIMAKGKITKENLQTFVQFLKTTKEATSRQMSKSGGIDRVTLGDYTIGAHAPHNGENHLDKGALANIKNTLIAFYKDQGKNQI